MKEGRHYSGERFWIDHQPWLKSCGYTLRERYQPGWVASWLKPGSKKPEDWWDCHDGLIPDVCNLLPYSTLLTRSIFLQFSHLIDASREDGSLVMLKHISVLRHPDEVEMGQLFSSKSFVSNPRNHCAPFYDVLQVPDNEDRVIIVMPLLYRTENPPFQTVGEVVEFFHQIFEVATRPFLLRL
jgi:hypothetical protein